jgi:hypothetical protein
MLARHTPEDLFVRIFVRAIQDDVRVPKTSQSKNGALFGGGQQSPPLFDQNDAWYGLIEPRTQAQSALPFMLEIIGHEAEADSIYNITTLVYLSQPEKLEYGYTANMRLFAFEFIGITETSNPAALDCLRAEFTRLIGHAPMDGTFELRPGRHELLLSSDAQVSQYGNSSIEISPIDIELANSCILAWKAITGSNPRFAKDDCSGSLATLKLEDRNTDAKMPKFVSDEPGERNTE